MPSSSSGGGGAPSTAQPLPIAQQYAPGRELSPFGGWQAPASAPLSPAPFSMANLTMPGSLQAGTMFRGQGSPQNMPMNMPPNFQQVPQMPPGIQINPQTGAWEPAGGWPAGMGPAAPTPEPEGPPIQWQDFINA